ncbi:unnamed protein product [Mytilus coruscus]|uniref:Uncharacterized protein n=1 Tax=Mytilus coruscus TaxID=42192 RepID=A0A6J8B442_MYTCO|nr:unnamed protein product [Mytilus coruscus]
MKCFNEKNPYKQEYYHREDTIHKYKVLKALFSFNKLHCTTQTEKNVNNDCKYSDVVPIYTTCRESKQAPPVGRQQQAFPVRTFKVFGGIQIGLGVLLGILSLIGVISDSRYYNDHAWFFTFDIACLICSGWKTGFMVCSIIGASIFIPAILSVGAYSPIITGNQDSKTVILSAFMAMLSFAEVVVAIIASSFCCCCSTWRKSIQEVKMFAPKHEHSPSSIEPKYVTQ